MPKILELRDRKSHAGTPLIHPSSEHVVLAGVFGVLKNLPFSAALNPWLKKLSGGCIASANDWGFSFWEKQPRPVGVHEGSTEVDLVMSSAQERELVFAEVKMDASPSSSTIPDPDRNQLIRNLDIGNRRASKESMRFSLVYITPDMTEPTEVPRIRTSKLKK